MEGHLSLLSLGKGAVQYSVILLGGPYGALGIGQLPTLEELLSRRMSSLIPLASLAGAQIQHCIQHLLS